MIDNITKVGRSASLIVITSYTTSGRLGQKEINNACVVQEIMNDHLHHETIIMVPATSQNKRLGLTVMAKKGTHSNISIALTKFLAFSLVHRTSVITK